MNRDNICFVLTVTQCVTITITRLQTVLDVLPKDALERIMLFAAASYILILVNKYLFRACNPIQLDPLPFKLPLWVPLSSIAIFLIALWMP